MIPTSALLKAALMPILNLLMTLGFLLCVMLLMSGCGTALRATGMIFKGAGDGIQNARYTQPQRCTMTKDNVGDSYINTYTGTCQ